MDTWAWMANERARRLCNTVRIVLWLVLYCGLIAVAGIGMAFAQATKLSNCSQTVGASAAPVAFPTAGGVGATFPTTYLEICNAHAANTLGVNVVGGTAAIGAAGTLTLTPGGCMWWDQRAIPGALSIIGSGASTTTSCMYH